MKFSGFTRVISASPWRRRRSNDNAAWSPRNPPPAIRMRVRSAPGCSSIAGTIAAGPRPARGRPRRLGQVKMVVAIVKPHKLDEVKEALQDVGVSGLTTTDVEGFGRQRGHTEVYRGAEYQVDFVPKVKVEVLAADDQVQGIVDAISKAARTGKIGDGKIFVLPAEQVTRIRTGVMGPVAVSGSL